MNEDPQLIRAWRAWVQTPPPTERFRARARGSPAVDVECEIDHLVTATASLWCGYLGGEPWPIVTLATNQLARIERVETAIARMDLPHGERGRYRAYLEQTRQLLARIRDTAVGTSGE
ncbi:MAG TPA: hypothetical protein VFS20_29935 [Longimicrobium sp.]|nr:hypothetical protein [Longimicrobium sp.]